jgi:hypothetical protein
LQLNSILSKIIPDYFSHRYPWGANPRLGGNRAGLDGAKGIPMEALRLLQIFQAKKVVIIALLTDFFESRNNTHSLQKKEHFIKVLLRFLGVCQTFSQIKK